MLTTHFPMKYKLNSIFNLFKFSVMRSSKKAIVEGILKYVPNTGWLIQDAKSKKLKLYRFHPKTNKTKLLYIEGSIIKGTIVNGFFKISS